MVLDTNAPKHFYMVVPPEPAFRELALLKALADPSGRGDPHITVKGPLDHPLPLWALEKANAAMRGKKCRVAGVGTFWDSEKTQHTVFLEVDCPVLEELWENPQRDPSERHLHLTMYDGPDREVAKAIKKALTKACVRVEFPLDGLVKWAKPEPTLSQRLGLPKFSPEDRMKALAKPSILTAMRVMKLADSMQALRQEMPERGSSKHTTVKPSQGSNSGDAVQVTDAIETLGYTKGSGQVPGTYRETTFGGERVEWVVAVSEKERVTLGVSRSGTEASYSLNRRTLDSLDDFLEALPETIPQYEPTSEDEADQNPDGLHSADLPARPA